MWDSLVTLVSKLTPDGGALQLLAGVSLALFNYRMWRSIGWLILGILMMWWGFLLWNRKGIAAGAKAAATVAAV